MKAHNTSIETHPTGAYFDFANLDAADVHVEDIALGLSQRCRFGAFTRRFYSVAEHALLVRRLVADVADDELAFVALHHDSHEAYIGDVPTPLKPWFGEPYKRLSTNIDAVIAERFGFDAALMKHDIIKAADLEALRIEAHLLKRSAGCGPHWVYWGLDSPPPEIPTGAGVGHDPQWAEALFLNAHRNALAAIQLER